MEAVIEGDRVIQHDAVINMLPRLTQKSVDYLESRKTNPKPFFLSVPLGSPHTPIVPTPEWQGKSGLGSYGDFVMQTDNVLGEINTALKDRSLKTWFDEYRMEADSIDDQMISGIDNAEVIFV